MGTKIHEAKVILPFKDSKKTYDVGDIYKTKHKVNIEILTKQKRIK